MFRNVIISVVMIASCVHLTSCIPQNNSVELVYDAKAGVGEGALWDSEHNRLLWIDITGKVLYIYYPDSREMHQYAMPSEIGTVVPLDSNSLVLALAHSICTFYIHEKILHAELLPDIDTTAVRFNDGKCAPDGSLWVGTMDYGVSEPIAALYRVSQGFKIEEKLDSITVSNGIIWSPDGTQMYYIDSPTYRVDAFDYRVETSDVSNRRTVIRIPQTWGSPDGSAIDEEGMLWIAHWGCGKVSRWNPLTGALLDTISVPAPNVTSVAFGGAEKDILFITTARNWMQEGDEERYPLAGGLFAIKPGVRGIQTYTFKP